MIDFDFYKHELYQRKNNFWMLEDFVHCMSRNGVDVCGQVGSNWVHASNLGVKGIRNYCEKLSEKYEISFFMAGYAMVEALRFLNVEKVALNAAYHWPNWWQGTVNFLLEAGFDVVWAGNFVDQGWFDKQEDLNAKRWVFEEELAYKSFAYVAEKAPNVDAYLINGMCNFKSKIDGLPQRPVHLETKLEAMLNKPMIGHDTALYWQLMKKLEITPTTEQGKLLGSLK